MKLKNIEEQLNIIRRGAVEIVSESELKEKIARSLQEKIPLRIKAGFDPTAADLHLGHTVLLKKLRQFQELGHQVIFIIGDFTARIGDPSGRSQLRKPLTKNQVEENAKTYKKQISKVLNVEKLEIVYNSSWFEKMQLSDFLKLTSLATVSQMLARADFKKRYSHNEDISLLEFMYPILQGYDSVMVRADIELGGADQIFNLLVGRQIQKDFGLQPQAIITMPLLEGTDGIQKMSKSYGNSIGIEDSPKEMFGKVMSIPDAVMSKYWELLTDFDLEELKILHPKIAKLKLAEYIVSQYHSPQLARKEKEDFERVFSQKEIPGDIESYKMSSPEPILDLLIKTGMVASRNEGRRLLKQKAVSINNNEICDENKVVDEPGILKVGKRRFLKIVF